MSARKLTLAHVANVIRQKSEGGRQDSDSDDSNVEKLKPDQMRLYNYYKPGLQANDYFIEVTQSISAPTVAGTQTLTLSNARNATSALGVQEFSVFVPHFTLDSALVNSYYPPDGHQDEGRVLPHLVLNDPHYPWEIPAGTTENMEGLIDRVADIDFSTGKQRTDPVTGAPKTVFRNLVPWVALVVFDPEELRIDTLDELSALNVPGFSSIEDMKKQNAKGTFSMSVADYFAVPTASRVNYESAYVGDDDGLARLKGTAGAVDVIFPEKALFNTLFNTDPESANHGLENQKYMAHVRNILTDGHPDVGINEAGLFSIVISCRTGSLDPNRSRAQVCHLVSTEHFDSTITGLTGTDRIGLVSLFSWVYTALPPNPVNFVDTMRNLTANQQMLRLNDKLLAQLLIPTAKDDDIRAKASRTLARRLKLGYTLARWRTQSGEETVAFNRGPLVPQPVPATPPGGLPDSSSTSQCYQTLDPETGIMDLSYSSAWQSGKLLAISDTVFSAALMRFRSQVHNFAADRTRMLVNGMTDKSRLLDRLTSDNIVHTVKELTSGKTGMPQRLRPPSSASPAPDVKHPDVSPTMRSQLRAAIRMNASSGEDIYNEFNLDGPNNNDWSIIHAWICEKLSLGGIPPQHLIPEPGFAPPESLRFFHIDDFWLDCLIDGALSVANHLDADDDVVRRMIKETFNLYLTKTDPTIGFRPQIPSYGFTIRSKLIKAMPDLKITVKWKSQDGRHPVCRWTKWDDETLMCLLDRQPEELDTDNGIVLSQPPHQQRFSLGSHLDLTTGITFNLRRLYTSDAPDTEWPDMPLTSDLRTSLPNWIDLPSRRIRPQVIAKAITDNLVADPSGPKLYRDPTPNPCVLGLELNDPAYFFAVVPSPASTVPGPPFSQRLRKLYVKWPDAVQARSEPSSVSVAAKATIEPARVSLRAVASATRASVASVPTFPNRQARTQSLPLTKQLSSARGAQLQATGLNSVSSHFNITVFPDYKGLPRRIPTGGKFDAKDYVPTQNVYNFDLIFTIQRPQPSNAQLLRIDVDIPVPSPNNPSLLTADYTGPGLRMLSNQRWIPKLFTPDDKAQKPHMRVQLIPRSANEGFAIALVDARTEEINFRLAEVNVSPVTVPQPPGGVPIDPPPAAGSKSPQMERVEITMTEWYVTDAFPDGAPVAKTYTVIKSEVQDDALGKPPGS
jgi:hypothetical protein